LKELEEANPAELKIRPKKDGWLSRGNSEFCLYSKAETQAIEGPTAMMHAAIRRALKSAA
jgi:hypothetical protein